MEDGGCGSAMLLWFHLAFFHKLSDAVHWPLVARLRVVYVLDDVLTLRPIDIVLVCSGSMWCTWSSRGCWFSGAAAIRNCAPGFSHCHGARRWTYVCTPLKVGPFSLIFMCCAFRSGLVVRRLLFSSRVAATWKCYVVFLLGHFSSSETSRLFWHCGIWKKMVVCWVPFPQTSKHGVYIIYKHVCAYVRWIQIYIWRWELEHHLSVTLGKKLERSTDFNDAGSLWFCVWRVDLSVVAEIVLCRSSLWWECWGRPSQAMAETGRGVAGRAERGRAGPGRPGPGWANPGWTPRWANMVQHEPTCPILDPTGPNGANLGQLGANLGPPWATLGQLEAILRPTWANLAQLGPNLTQLGPNLAQLEPNLGPTWANLGQTWANLGPTWG